MSSAIITLLISHLLTYVESELESAEPKIVADITSELKLLVSKLEAFISSKSSSLGTVTAPVLNAVSSATISAVQAAGAALTQEADGASNAS